MYKQGIAVLALCLIVLLIFGYPLIHPKVKYTNKVMNEYSRQLINELKVQAPHSAWGLSVNDESNRLILRITDLSAASRSYLENKFGALLEIEPLLRSEPASAMT